MPVRFRVPPPPRINVYPIDRFQGVDFTSNPGNVSPTMSPNCKNMIRAEVDKVRKCMGYHTFAHFDGRINGFHELLLKGNRIGLIHAGTKFYLMPAAAPLDVTPPEPIYTTANDARSESWQVKDKTYIVDGKTLLVFNGTTVKPVSEDAYVPTLTIGKDPKGGGTEYEALNLLQPKFTELFGGTESDTDYHLTFSGLDDSPVQAFVLNGEGDWVEKKEGTDFTVDRATGVVKFNSTPGKSPITGEDNVKITASRTVEGYSDRINKCRFGILFGVNGASDRLFLSGNPDSINYDWFSGLYDPTYWPDTGYGVMGTADSAIVGYSIVSNHLATHKDDYELERNVIVRAGNLVENEPAFPIVNTLQGPGAMATWSFAYLGTEPVFLTPLGVYAITPSDINGERYQQLRSYFLNGKLNKEPNREEAFAFVYHDLYWLCLNGVAYILDGAQLLNKRQESSPYSTRQYAGFYRTNLPARVMWQLGETLCFGTPGGDVCAFYTDSTDLSSYNDNGEPIHAVWETPDLNGHLFFKNKSFRSVSVQLASAVATGVDIWAQRRGLWGKLISDHKTGRYFSYSALTYSKFTYSNDQPNKTLFSKIRLKRLDKVRFRFENKELKEAFGLLAWAVEYTESGNFKG